MLQHILCSAHITEQRFIWVYIFCERTKRNVKKDNYQFTLSIIFIVIIQNSTPALVPAKTSPVVCWQQCTRATRAKTTTKEHYFFAYSIPPTLSSHSSSKNRIHLFSKIRQATASGIYLHCNPAAHLSCWFDRNLSDVKGYRTNFLMRNNPCFFLKSKSSWMSMKL